MTYQTTPNSLAIARLNDAFRQSLINPRTRPNLGMVMLTQGIQCQPLQVREQILQAIAQFDSFNKGNDPYNEHDFGAIEHPRVGTVWFKIDYYDRTLEEGSPDPANPQMTCRVMTIMLPEEY